MPIITVTLIVGGAIFAFSTGGLNLGIDFRAGLNVRVQIAPVAATVSYEGVGNVNLDIRGETLIIERTTEEESERYEYELTEYSTLDALDDSVSEVEGVEFVPVADGSTSPAVLLSLERSMSLNDQGVELNMQLPEGDSPITVGEVREALASVGEPQIQTIGSARDQEFMIRMEEPEGARDFDQEATGKITALLRDSFGTGSVLIRRTDYVGARFSRNLSQQVVYLSVLALLLILAYTWFRFKLAYAVSAIAALVHDSLFIFAFFGLTGLEFSTATIAAVLTIIGYSLNDTIVIFDRIRENTGILRTNTFPEIIDTSISQSLSRTLMTSFTTLLAVAAIYIFGTGSIRDFALALIVGVLIGTYSSIFVASPILNGWMSVRERKRRKKEVQQYGARVAERPAAPAKSGATAGGEKSSGGSRQRSMDEIPKAERKLKGKRQRKK